VIHLEVLNFRKVCVSLLYCTSLFNRTKNNDWWLKIGVKCVCVFYHLCYHHLFNSFLRPFYLLPSFWYIILIHHLDTSSWYIVLMHRFFRNFILCNKYPFFLSLLNLFFWAIFYMCVSLPRRCLVKISFLSGNRPFW